MQKRSNQNVDVPYKVDNCMDHVDRNYELFHKRTKTDMQSYHCPATMTSRRKNARARPAFGRPTSLFVSILLLLGFAAFFFFQWALHLLSH